MPPGVGWKATLSGLQKLFDEQAWANQVYPINEGSGLIHLWRPSSAASLHEPVRITADTPTLERYRSSRLIAGRSFAIDVRMRLDIGNRYDHGFLKL